MNHCFCHTVPNAACCSQPGACHKPNSYHRFTRYSTYTPYTSTPYYIYRVITFCLLLLAAHALPLCAQQSETLKERTERLFAHFKQASRFDYNYPREKVYLHFDNSAYLEGDTIWYKAYVVRASTLQPTTLSRVLYVELLNADGQLMEKQTLRIDSLGQADGSLSLNLPVRAGYYEVRAYTRAMTNWDDAACFSRVFPVFTTANPQMGSPRNKDLSLNELAIPEPTPNKRVTYGAPRPYVQGDSTEKLLSFFPEGGLRAKGVAQQVAFKLTDGRGFPLADTLLICNERGEVVSEAMVEHEGMGSFVLPADFAGGYALLKEEQTNPAPNSLAADGGRRALPQGAFALPSPASAYALHTQWTHEGLFVSIAANDSAAAGGELLGLAAFCREKACFFDTLSVSSDPVEILIPERALRRGVNRIELFDLDGQSRASRLVWCEGHEASMQHPIQVEVRQNEAVYAAFSPAVLELKLTDSQGKGVSTTVSVAVRDEEGNLIENADCNMSTDLLLASELRGYIHRPESYFAANDALHRRRLDLLLMVQGWTASDFATLCAADTFQTVQPIEDKLIVRGTLFKENNKREPQPFMNLQLLAYSLNGDRIEGETRTDSLGRFAFESNIDFTGDFIAQFTSTNDQGKRKWGRLTLDRWFAPSPHAFTGPELTLTAPTDNASRRAAGGGAHLREPLTFAWTDTIPRTLPTMLGEANVKVKNKYRGFTGNRYTWRGGEKHGMQRATKFYNIEQECEHVKDMGLAPGYINDLLALLESNFEHSRSASVGAALASQAAASAQSARDAERHITGNPDATSGAPMPSVSGGSGEKGTQIGVDPKDMIAQSDFAGRALQPDWTYRGLPIVVYLNNELLGPLVQRFPELYSDIQAEEIKSVSIVHENQQTDAVSGKTKRFSREKYKMYMYENPDHARYRSTKGKEKRRIQGFSHRRRFYAPNYRSFDLPSASDLRRTLHWAPSVRTDANGRAHLIFFTNAHEKQVLDISVRGITTHGETIDFDNR